NQKITMATYREGIATFVADVDIEKGAICVLTDACTLTPASSSVGENVALFAAEISQKAGKLISAKIIGASTGTVTTKATAGDFKPGVPVYAADDGKVALSGSRIVGVYIGEAKTATDDEPIHVAPVFVA
ncbi:MAG: hypothetical protein LUD72_09815, partial [Bacteroidales bacterium]|nr:hypothetical protein [Bacteroidales bacterium]